MEEVAMLDWRTAHNIEFGDVHGEDFQVIKLTNENMEQVFADFIHTKEQQFRYEGRPENPQAIALIYRSNNTRSIAVLDKDDPTKITTFDEGYYFAVRNHWYAFTDNFNVPGRTPYEDLPWTDPDDLIIR
jgi:hypothetical protein